MRSASLWGSLHCGTNSQLEAWLIHVKKISFVKPGDAASTLVGLDLCFLEALNRSTYMGMHVYAEVIYIHMLRNRRVYSFFLLKLGNPIHSNNKTPSNARMIG